MRELLGLAGALVLLGFLGDGILGLLGGRKVLSSGVWPLAAVWIGGGLGLPVFQVPGVPFFWGTAGMMIAACAVQAWAWRTRQVSMDERSEKISETHPARRWASQSKIGWWILMALATAWVGLLSAQAALVSPVEGVTGLGNWLFKAKVILENGSMPGDFFSWAGENRHVGYPPGFPILCAWAGWWMGGLDLVLIRALPWLAWTAGFFLLAGSCGRSLRGAVALLGLTILFSSTYGQLSLRYFFAEPLLMFGVAVVVAVVIDIRSARCHTAESPESRIQNEERRRCVGWAVFFLVLGPLGWVKQEGAVLAGLLAGFVWLQASGFGLRRRTVFLGWLGGFLIWVLPWSLAVWMGGVTDENFSAGRALDEDAWERLKLAAEVYFAYAWKQGENFAGAWWLLPVAAGLAFVKKDRLALGLLGTAMVYIAVVVLAMAGSMQEDFHWHLMAATRVLLVPSALVIIAFGVTEGRFGKMEPKTNL